MDKRERKLFVGDQKGRLFSINIKNGAKMKKFKKSKKSGKKEKNDVSCLYYWPEKTSIISSSWD